MIQKNTFFLSNLDDKEKKYAFLFLTCVFKTK